MKQSLNYPRDEETAAMLSNLPSSFGIELGQGMSRKKGVGTRIYESEHAHTSGYSAYNSQKESRLFSSQRSMN